MFQKHMIRQVFLPLHRFLNPHKFYFYQIRMSRHTRMIFRQTLFKNQMCIRDSFAGITTYASNWMIYQGTDINSDKVAAEYHTNEDGKVDQITFDLPDNSYDGVFTNMYVDLMGYSPDAYLPVSYTHLDVYKRQGNLLNLVNHPDFDKNN